jgi:hypothetical protein
MFQIRVVENIQGRMRCLNGCRGFLNVSKVALEKAVECIFNDKGTTDVLRALFRGDEWRTGVITHSFLLTIADYLSDLNDWLDPPFYKRAVHVRCPAAFALVCSCSDLHSE